MSDKRYRGEVDRMRSPQRVQLLEIERVLELAADGITIQSALDIGTGSGLFAEAFAQRGWAAAGIDVRPEMLAVARQHVPNGDFREATAEALPFQDDTFDLAFMGHVYHEATNRVKALQEAKRVSTQRVVILEWPYGAAEFGPPPDHRLQPETVQAEAQQAGFGSIETLPLTHMVLYRLS